MPGLRLTEGTRDPVVEDALIQAGPSGLQNRTNSVEKKLIEDKQEFVEDKQRAEERLRSFEWRQRKAEREFRELKELAKKQLAYQRWKDAGAHGSGPLDASARKNEGAVIVRQDAVKVVSNAKGKVRAKAKHSVDDARHDEQANVANGLEDTNNVVAGPLDRDANSSMRDQVKSAVGARVRDVVKVGSGVKFKNWAKAKDRVDKAHHAGPSNAEKGLDDTTPSQGDPLKVALNPNDVGNTQSLSPDASQDHPATRLPIPLRSKPTYHRVPSPDIAPRSIKDNVVYQYRARPRPPGVKFADLLVDNITNPKERWFGKNTPRTKDLLQHCAAALVTLSFPGLGANQVVLFACGSLSSNDLGRLAGRQIAARLEELSVRGLLLLSCMRSPFVLQRAAKTWPLLPPLKLGDRWLRTLRLEDLTLASLTPCQTFNYEDSRCVWWKANLMMAVTDGMVKASNKDD